MAKLFGTDGVRGIVGDLMTPEFSLRMGHAIGAYFGKGSRLLIGRDVRLGGDMILRSLTSGLLAEGVKVYDSGLLPTPALQFGIKSLGFDGGVMITASHNPPEYNGIKVISNDGIEIPHENEDIIENYYFNNYSSKMEWRSFDNEVKIKEDIIDLYIDGVLSQVDVEKIAKKNFRVVIDCANSVGSLTAPLLLRKLGVKAYTLNCNLDPYFPGRNPEPNADTLQYTMSYITLVKADAGFAHDGDADRAMVLDNNGRIQWGDRTGALLTEFSTKIWKNYNKKTYTSISSSNLVEEYLKPKGIEVGWTPVGSVTIAREISKRKDAISGFEDNGGYMHVPHHIVRDGAMTIALTLYMLSEYNESLANLYDKLPQYYPIKTKITANKEQASCGVEAVKEKYSSYRILTIDGVKVFGDDFWLLVRPSGTEPLLRIFGEAKSPKKVEEIVNDTVKLIKEKCIR
ncbi:MAG: phosphoglucosamine mutase [Caldisphaera sp.]|nr:MAG: phosphoglucosamine mutase [Caldisphaera sp.]PMP90124.1 MAG: phosphoglucosamine mutase [Caldisphaera sp.]